MRVSESKPAWCSVTQTRPRMRSKVGSTLRGTIPKTCCRAWRWHWMPMESVSRCACSTTAAIRESRMNPIIDLPADAVLALKRLRPQWQMDGVSDVELLVGGYANENYALTYRDSDYVLRIARPS